MEHPPRLHQGVRRRRRRSGTVHRLRGLRRRMEVGEGRSVMTEQTEPVVWYISAADSAEALRVLQEAYRRLRERAHSLKGAHVAVWPGYEIRIYTTGSAQLLADPTHGAEIHRLATSITRHGRATGI